MISKPDNNPFEQYALHRIVINYKYCTEHSNRPTGTDRPESIGFSSGLVKAALTEHQKADIFFFLIDHLPEAADIARQPS
jgi:hypothetical protein